MKDILSYLYPLLEADEVSRQEWQLLTAIHDDADILVLCVYLQGYYRTHYHHLCFGLVKTDIPQFLLQSCRYDIISKYTAVMFSINCFCNLISVWLILTNVDLIPLVFSSCLSKVCMTAPLCSVLTG
jgi:hypothetical protein